MGYYIFRKKELKKIEQKFNIGDEIKTANEEPLTITKIDEKGYWSKDLLICSFGDAAKWKLVEQKTAWSKEVQEEQVSEEFINTLGAMLNDGLPDRYLVSEERIKKSAELLFSIARKQLKNEIQEWSEEDKTKLKTACTLIRNTNLKEVDGIINSTIDWLKSLKQRYT